jgi:anti-anti-sigma factor
MRRCIVTARLRITEERRDDITILRLSGRLELNEGDLVFRNHVDGLVAEGRRNIVVDLNDVRRIDSAGIGMLVSKYLTAQKHGGSMKLLHLTRRSEHLMDITWLAKVFEIFEDEARALQSFGVAS